jgi:hypothetical protein
MRRGNYSYYLVIFLIRKKLLDDKEKGGGDDYWVRVGNLLGDVDQI